MITQMFCRKPEREGNSCSRLPQTPSLPRAALLWRPCLPGPPRASSCLASLPASCSHTRAHLTHTGGWRFRTAPVCCLRQAQAEFPEWSISNRHPAHKQPLWFLSPARLPGPRLPWAGWAEGSPAAGGMPGVVWGLRMRPWQAGLCSAPCWPGWRCTWLPHAEGGAVRTRVMGKSAFLWRCGSTSYPSVSDS